MRKHAHFLLPSLLLIALFLPGVNQGALRVDSDIYAAIGLHAWREGTLFPLMAGDQPYLNKPPVAIWIHGLFLHLFGPSLFAARFPTLLATLGALLFSISTARVLAGKRVALLSGLILAATPEVFRHTHAIALDAWLMLFFTAMLWCAACAARRPRRAVGALLAAGVPFGLALLTKPFVAVIPWLILGAWLTKRRIPLRTLIPTWFATLVIALAIAVPWHLAMHARFGDAFTSEYVGSQTLDRATGAHGSEPFYAYLLTLLSTYWPWLLALIPALIWSIKSLLPSPSHRPTVSKALPRLPLNLISLSLLWTGCWLVVLSLFADKAGRYLLPVYPALSWLIAAWASFALPPRLRAGIHRLAPRVTLAISAGLVILALTPVRIHEPRSDYWAKLNAYLDTLPAGTQLWTAPQGPTLGANIYLDRGIWPTTARAIDDPQFAKAPAPPIGAILIMRPNAGIAPRPADKIIFEDPRVIVLRTQFSWDGRYSTRSK